MVGSRCAVYGCSSHSSRNNDLKFHRFPRDDERRMLWIGLCQRPDLKTKTFEQLYNMCVCSLHFERWMYIKTKLKSAAIPTLNLSPNFKHSMITPTKGPSIRVRQDLFNDGDSDTVSSVVASTSAQESETTEQLEDSSMNSLEEEDDGIEDLEMSCSDIQEYEVVIEYESDDSEEQTCEPDDTTAPIVITIADDASDFTVNAPVASTVDAPAPVEVPTVDDNSYFTEPYMYDLLVPRASELKRRVTGTRQSVSPVPKPGPSKRRGKETRQSISPALKAGPSKRKGKETRQSVSPAPKAGPSKRKRKEPPRQSASSMPEASPSKRINKEPRQSTSLTPKASVSKRKEKEPRQSTSLTPEASPSKRRRGEEPCPSVTLAPKTSPSKGRQKGVNGNNLQKPSSNSVEGDFCDSEDEDLLEFDNDDTTLESSGPIEISRTADCYPADDDGLTTEQIAALRVYEEADNLFVRDLAPSNDFLEFNWTSDKHIFTGKREVFSGTPGPTFPVTKDMKPIDVFYKMFDMDFIDMLVEQTNLYADQTVTRMKNNPNTKKHSRWLRWTPTDRDEMISFLAFIILQGIYPKVREEAYFSFDGFGTTPFFGRIMSYNRYMLLKMSLHFTDNETAQDTTKIKKIRPVIDYLNDKFSALYYPEQNVAIDESLLKWHGRLSFAQKIATKAAQVGVKTYELCESSSGYLWQFRVYTGKDSTNETRQNQQSDDHSSQRNRHDDQDSQQDEPDNNDIQQEQPNNQRDLPDNHHFLTDLISDHNYSIQRNQPDDHDSLQDRPDDNQQGQPNNHKNQEDLSENQEFQRDGPDNHDNQRGQPDEQSVSNFRLRNSTSRIVYDLIKPLLHRGHTLIMDNFYNSPLLARCLKYDKTDVYGTMRLSREFVPETLKPVKKTDLQRGQVVESYCSDLSLILWRDAKLVSMISTFHPFQMGPATKQHTQVNRPTVVIDYNKSMGGVDRKDQYLASQPLERQRNKIWYKKLFRRLYNAALFNCFVIYSSNAANKHDHRLFRVTLAEDLLRFHRNIDLKLEPKLIRHKQTSQLVVRQSTMSRPYVASNHFPIRTGSKCTRCVLCYKNKRDTRTVYKCEECNVNLCILHCFKAYHKQEA